jgi:hypothetical protein
VRFCGPSGSWELCGAATAVAGIIESPKVKSKGLLFSVQVVVRVRGRELRSHFCKFLAVDAQLNRPTKLSANYKRQVFDVRRQGRILHFFLAHNVAQAQNAASKSLSSLINHLEDPRLNQRKDNEIFSAFGSKENRAKLARLRRGTGTVLDVEYDLANTTKLPWKKFETNGMQITADVRPEFGLHGLFKMVNKTGKTLGSGVLCLRDIMRKKEMQDTTLPTHIEHLPLVVGGQLRGTIELSINCQKLTKMAAEFAAPDTNDNLNREQEAF